jgi:hypothetical protein
MKNRYTIPLFLLALVLAGFLGWFYFTTTPQYSLYQLYEAIKARDYAAFTYYVDVDSLANNAIDHGLGAAEREAEKRATNPLVRYGREVVGKLVVSARPKLVEAFKSRLKNEVASGNISEISFDQANLLVVFLKIDVEKNGKVADVLVPISKRKPLALKMRKVENHWQVFDIDINSLTIKPQL